MPASPAPADNGRDDDLAWLDRDPMTAAEREASLDRLCEQDEGHHEDEADRYGEFEPFTPGELLRGQLVLPRRRRERLGIPVLLRPVGRIVVLRA